LLSPAANNCLGKKLCLRRTIRLAHTFCCNIEIYIYSV
jgi:hypothetical protein